LEIPVAIMAQLIVIVSSVIALIVTIVRIGQSVGIKFATLSQSIEHLALRCGVNDLSTLRRLSASFRRLGD